MKLSVTIRTLKGLADDAAKAVASRSTLPVLGNLLIQGFEDGRLRVTGTNLALAIAVTTPAQVKKPGAITVPAKTLIDLLGSYHGSTEAELTLDPKTTSLIISTKVPKSKHSLKGISAEEFPAVPDGEGLEAVTITPEDFRTVLARVPFVASTAEERPILMAVHVSSQDGTARFEAADGFRLAGQKTSAAGPNLNIGIPAVALTAFKPFVTGDTDLVSLATINNSQAILRCGMATVVSQLIEGSFPDLSSVTPKSHSTRLVISRTSFLAACKAADVIARHVSHTVRLKVFAPKDNDPGHVHIAAVSVEDGDGITDLDATVTGPGLEIAFNARYLIEVLSALDTEQVALDFTVNTSPAVVRPVGTGETDYAYIAMPMHVGK